MRRLGDTERARRDLRVRARLERSPARPARGARALAHRIRHGIRTRRTHRIRLARLAAGAQPRRVPRVRRARHPRRHRGLGFSLSPRVPAAPIRQPRPRPQCSNPNSSRPKTSLATARAVRIAASRRAVPPARRAFSARGASISARWLGLAGTRHLWIILRENNSLLKRNGGDVGGVANGGGLSARLGRGALPRRKAFHPIGVTGALERLAATRASSVRIPATTRRLSAFSRRQPGGDRTAPRAAEAERGTPVRRGPSWRSPAPGSYRAGCCSGRTRRTPRRVGSCS